MTGIVVVTGASAGIGRATAIEFARRGWSVGLLARASQRLDDAVAEVGAFGPTIGLPADIADPEQVECAAAEVEARWGRIDVWVNNAMATVYAPVRDITADEIKRVTDVTYHGAVWGTQVALRRMRPRNHGCIVQVGSALAYRSIPLQSAYCGAKSALRAFTDSLRSELIREGSGIRLTMVHLAAFNTPQFDWGRAKLECQPRPVGTVFQPEIAADAIVTAATRRRREWWVGLPTVQSILGQRFAARYLDRRLADEAWEGQHGGELLPDDRPDNLWESAPGRQGARGRFSREARAHSLAWTLNKHRAALLTLAGTVAIGSWVAWWIPRRHR